MDGEKRVSFSNSDGNAGIAIVKQATQFLGDDMLDPHTSAAVANTLQMMLNGSKLNRNVSRGLTRRNTPNNCNQSITHMEQVEERLKGLDTVVLLAALLAAVGVEAQGGLEDVDYNLGHASIFCLHSGIMITLTVTIVVTCISVHTRRCFDLSKSITGALNLLDELAWMFEIAYKCSVAGCFLIMLGLSLLTCIRDDDPVIIALNCLATMACGVLGMWSLKIIFQKQKEASIPRKNYYMVKYDQVPNDSIMLIAQSEDDEGNYQLFNRSWEKYCRFLYNFHCENPNEISCILPSVSSNALQRINKYVRDKAYKKRESKIKDVGSSLKELLDDEDYDAFGEIPFDEFMDILNGAVELEMDELLKVLQCIFATRCYLLKREEIESIFIEKEWQTGKHALILRQSVDAGEKVAEIAEEYFDKIVEHVEDWDEELAFEMLVDITESQHNTHQSSMEQAFANMFGVNANQVAVEIMEDQTIRMQDNDLHLDVFVRSNDPVKINDIKRTVMGSTFPATAQAALGQATNINISVSGISNVIIEAISTGLDSDEDSDESQILTILLEDYDSTRNDRVFNYIKDDYQNLYEGLNVEFPEEFWKSACDKIEMYHGTYTISAKAWKLCGYTAIPNKDGVLRVNRIGRDVFELILDYLNHHDGKTPVEIPKPIRYDTMEKICEDAWDARFVDGLSKRMLFQIILGANLLDCKPLLHLGCAKVATMIKGKSPEEIKQILGKEENEKDDSNEDEFEEPDSEAGVVVETPSIPTTEKREPQRI